MYVYIQTERNPALFTVGFYKPDGAFETDSDHSDRSAARERVAYLNGGGLDLHRIATAMELIEPRTAHIGATGP